ncbi:MAG TPA: orotidine-5'-phosphate decarboxylase [Candidatus Sumerlaeota bacterium]|nr:orotidine-5'-phosphate decarboxylase [Candidatus Sumerlaeota bacterium]HOR27757.1 orotidine-5'-phosphate decarboxylase [Candidatus Sumerlaeota bacterium]HPK01365.1 orotidine-5'-phosphate decarboxylase [Candidatus Sumerlaeota bacterium]
MELRTFFERLAARCDQTGASLCIGLDPDPTRLPRHLGSGPEAIYRFCVEIIEATADHAAAFKPNLAFFEAIGVEGWHVLDQVLRAVPQDVPVILDAKRGDIGSTARMYARSLFDRLRAGAVTVNPYMGYDSVEPFLEFERNGTYVLCLTSNQGAFDFQLADDLYLRVARRVREWNTRGNCGMVVGATKPQFLTSIRAIAPEIPLLIPGLGAQGGDLEATLAAAPDAPPHHLLFNVSRSIIYAADDASFGRQARVAARYYLDRIQRARRKVLGLGTEGAEE